MARPASIAESSWLPTFGWWPPGEFEVNVLMTPFHNTIESDARFSCTMRGYEGSADPVWEHDAGEIAYGDQTVISLAELDIPAPSEAGGILEVHVIRLDKAPRRGVGYNSMWIDARHEKSGGYIIPTIPMRAMAKELKRDDLQIVPGVICSREVETEVVILNTAADTMTAHMEVSSVEGAVVTGDEFQVPVMGAWRGDLRKELPRARKLLETSEGIGSLAIYSSHRCQPLFGFRREGQPFVSMDHSAPIFA